MRRIFSYFLIGLLLHSCEKDETIGIPGKFELQFISIHESTSPISTQVASLQGSYSQDVNEIFLDTLKSSKSFYFKITNSGQYDITDVTMTTDNENFIVSPTSIPLIPGTFGDELLNQVFSIDVLHGTKINGFGSREFLKEGDNFCNLSIKGKTFDGESTTTISLNAKIKVYAKIMSISIFQGRFEYDLNTPDHFLFGGGPYSIDEMDIFHYYTINPPVTIRNTGNVNLEMTLASFETDHPIIQTAMIRPNDTMNLILPFGESDYIVGGMIRLDSEGTIFDINKLSMGRDGAAYFALVYPSEFWRTNHTSPDRIY
jgi:hypothetical protein